MQKFYYRNIEYSETNVKKNTKSLLLRFEEMLSTNLFGRSMQNN